MPPRSAYYPDTPPSHDLEWHRALSLVLLVQPLERIHELLPPYPGEQYPALPDLRELYSGMEQEGVRLAADAKNGDSPHLREAEA